MTILGMNLGGVNYYSPEVPTIDRVRIAMPSDSKVAGQYPFTVPLDPGKHDYVMYCDAAVTKIGSPAGNFFPKDGRATATINMTNAALQLTLVSPNPITTFSVMRAEHEAAYRAGELFNPDFITKVAPFKLIRTLDWDGTNAANYPNPRPKLTDPYWQDTTGAMPLELGSQLCAKIGAKRWAPIHHLVTGAQLLATLPDMAVCDVDLELGNEVWNSGMGSKSYSFFLAQAAVTFGTAKPTALDAVRYYGLRAGQLASFAAQVSPRFRVNLCWQMGNGVDAVLTAMLAGWDQSKAPRSLIAGFGVAPYINGNRDTGLADMLALQKVNDTEGFYKLIDSKRAERVSWLQAIQASCAKAGLAFKVYETNQSVITAAPAMTDAAARTAFLAWAEPLLHSDRMADIVMQNAKDAIAAGASELCLYQLTGGGSQYGYFGAMPHVAADPYPIYNKWAALAQDLAASPVPPVPKDSLAQIATDLQGIVSRIQALQK